MYIKHPSQHNQETRQKPSDRRTLKRRHLIYYLRVWEMFDDRLLGHLVDLTSEGMMLISERPIEIGREFELEIRFPDSEGELKPIGFRAVCRWSDNDINPAFYDSGFEFMEKTPEGLESIRTVIEHYGFQD